VACGSRCVLRRLHGGCNGGLLSLDSSPRKITVQYHRLGGVSSCVSHVTLYRANVELDICFLFNYVFNNYACKTESVSLTLRVGKFFFGQVP
jgi:hypothetical protein